MTLIEAIQTNNEKVFFELLNLRVNPLEKRIINEVDVECAGNALYWAAACGHLHFVESLINAGTNVNQANNLGWTPVYIAAYYGRAEIITVLKAAGADVNTPNDNGTTPVCAATYTGNAAAITALKAADANVDTPEINGLTPIYIAVQMRDVKVINALLEARANANIKTPHGTPLELAKQQGIEQRDQDILSLLEAHLKRYPNGIKTQMVSNTDLAQEAHQENFTAEVPRYDNPNVEAKADRDVITVTGGIRGQREMIIGGGSNSVSTETNRSSSEPVCAAQSVDRASSGIANDLSAEVKTRVERDVITFTGSVTAHVLRVGGGDTVINNFVCVNQGIILDEADLNLEETQTFKTGSLKQIVLPVSSSYFLTLAAPNAISKRRNSNMLDLTDKKEENEKICYVLERLKKIFLEERDIGGKTKNYDVYNGYLKIVHKDAELIYKEKQNKHVLYVNEMSLDAEAAAKEISKMIKSLGVTNVPQKTLLPLVLQPMLNVSFASINNLQTNTLTVVPALKVNPSGQKHSSGSTILPQFNQVSRKSSLMLNNLLRDSFKIGVNALKQTINFIEAINKNNQKNTSSFRSLQPLWKNASRLQDIEKWQQHFKKTKECVPFSRYHRIPTQPSKAPQSEPSKPQPQRFQSLEQQCANDFEKSKISQLMKDIQKHSPKVVSFF